jgi:hypothetical protein
LHRLENEFRDDITEALRAAGLISDSPPGSPYHITENNVVETDNVAANKDNAIGCIDNVLDLDCHPEYPTSKEDDCAVVCLFLNNSVPSEPKSKLHWHRTLVLKQYQKRSLQC